MRIFHGFDALPRFRHAAATVGSFDGVHRGHRALIGHLVDEARKCDGESVVLTFEPHPRITLGRAEGLVLLTTFEEKAALLEELGVDNLIVIPFDRSFSRLSCREFIEEYLLGKVGVETLVVGFNHRFGHDGVDFSTLEIEGLRIVRVDEERVTGEKVSSTVIRNLMAEGDIAEAERLLGHPVKLKI